MAGTAVHKACQTFSETWIVLHVHAEFETESIRTAHTHAGGFHFFPTYRSTARSTCQQVVAGADHLRGVKKCLCRRSVAYE
jgi:hypothetical protein